MRKLKKIEVLRELLNENISILRCPVCKKSIKYIKESSVLCENNHCFNISKKGYSGINELDKYYMDYFKCDKLTDKYLRKIIKGKQTYIKESNNKINKLAYKYYYENVFIIKNNNLDLDIYLNKRNYTNAYENYLYDMDISLELKKIT